MMISKILESNTIHKIKKENKNMSAKKMFWTGLIFQAIQFGVLALIVIVTLLASIEWNLWVVAGVAYGLMNIVSLILIITGAIKMKE
jgi:hypothetical protein